jgi:hypothetical protein
VKRLREFFGSRAGRITGIAGLIVLGGILGGVVATALPAIAAGQGGSPAKTSSTTSSYCQAFLATLESQLHVTEQQLIDANKAAIQSVLQQAVKNGAITHDQANQIEQKVDQASNGGICAALSFGRAAGIIGARGLGGLLGQVRQAVVSAVAAKLNISTATLQSDLQQGQSIVTLASQHGMSQSTLNTTIINAARAQLDTAVQQGQITSAQETQAINLITRAINQGAYRMVGLGDMPPTLGGTFSPAGGL